MSDPTPNPSTRARRLARARGDIPTTYPHKTFRDGAVVSDGFNTTKSEKRMIKHSVFMDKVENSAQASKQPQTQTQTQLAHHNPTAASTATTSAQAPANPLRGSPRAAKPATKSSILRARAAKITKPSTLSNAKRSKVRRPSKKLRTTLSALADALPSLERADGKAAAGGGMVLEGPERGKVRHQSLPSKAGALKKKEVIVRGEMERFALNMARLAGPKTGAGRGAPQSARGTGTAEMDIDESANHEEQSGTSDRWKALRGYITSTMERNPAFVS